ncbi:MAG: DUF1009 family protein [Candidatus Omnitrophota bacterium]|jgi:DUF1009 family protein
MLHNLFKFKLSALPNPKKHCLGVVAASGKLPIQILENAKSQGYRLIVLGVELKDDRVEALADEYLAVKMTEGQKALDYLVTAGVKHLVLCGKFPKTDFASHYKPDSLIAGTLKKTLNGKGDDGILKAISGLLRLKGIKVLPILPFLIHAAAPKGVLTKTKPTQAQFTDLAFGFRMAKKIGRLDIGQTVVIKNEVVLAVEAIEGTDATIRRINEFNSEGAAVVKVSKPQQELRFDMPVIGLSTIESLIAAKCACIGIEAGKTLLVDQSDVIELADKNQICVVGITQ